MAKVLLPFVRYKEVAPLPPVCIRCGRPATRTIKLQFQGKVVKILGIRILTGGMFEYAVVKAPLCDRHPYMGQAKLMMFVGFALLLPFFGLGALTKPWMHHYVIVFPLIAMILAGSAFIAYVFITSIDGEGFSDEGVTATRVSRKFVDALEERKWTEDAFVAGLRKNRKARKRPKPAFWFSPWFFVPVAMALAVVIFAPVGWLTASFESTGPWPAGIWARHGLGPGGPEVAGPGGQAPPGQQPANTPPEALNPRSVPGLIAYWPLDEGTGTSAEDKSGNGILALLHGGEWVPGVKGSALRLDGKADYLDLGPDARLNFGAGAPFTLAGWIATEADEGIVCSFRRRTAGFPVIEIFVKAGNLHGWVRDDTSGFGGARVAGGLVKDGNWRHVALVRHPDGTVELFLDAAFQAKDKGENSGGAITTDLRALGSERFVVQSKKPGPTYFAGSIDEFCVFNRALTPEEIAVLAGGKR